MRSSTLQVGSLLFGTFLAVVALVGNGCQTSGNEGDTCNSLVSEDECHSGLHCTQTTCTYAYCCPTSGVSSNPNCNFGGCPADDAGDDAADDSGDDSGDDATDDAGSVSDASRD